MLGKPASPYQESEILENEDSHSKPAYWLEQLDLAKKEFSGWQENSKRIMKIYKNRDGDDNMPYTAIEKRSKIYYNILYSNVQTLVPLLYSAPSRPSISRRVLDNEPIAREASEIMQRMINFCNDINGFDDKIRQLIFDYATVGMGVGKVCYEFEEGIRQEQVQEQQIDPVTGQTIIVNQTVSYPFKKNENVYLRYYYYLDFYCQPRRQWCDVDWVAFCDHLSHEELEQRFGQEIAEKLEMIDKKPDDGSKDSRYKVYEIWCKASKKVYWVTENYEGFLKAQDDPLNLKNFFPCPMPMIANKTNDNMIPNPDYDFYAYQAADLNRVTRRISKLVEATKFRGAYDPSIQNMKDLASAEDTNMIPLEDFQSFAKNGGLKSVMDFMDVSTIVSTAQSLVTYQQQLINEIYQITGFSDLIRGQNADPRETATAGRLKAQFGNTKLGLRQALIEEFIRGVYRIQAEIIAEQFSPQTLEFVYGKPIDDQIMAMLRDNRLRDFKIDVETDVTAAFDNAEEKRQRVEFLQALGGFLTQMMPLVQAGLPQQVVTELILFGAQAFKVGRKFEDSIAALGQMPPPQPQQADSGKEAQNEKELVAKKMEIDSKTAIEMRKIAQKEQEIALRQQELLQRGQSEAVDQRLEASKIGLEQQKLMTQGGF